MSSQPNKITFKKVLQYLIILVIASALIYYSFRGVDWAEFWNGLAGCNWLWIALSMGVGVLEFVIRAIRWYLLLREIHPESRILNAYRGVTIGNVANFALPRVGEIVRCTVVSTSDKVPFEGAVGTVVVERVWDLICLFLFTFAMLFTPGKFGAFINEHIFGGITISSHTWGVIAGVATGLIAVLIGYLAVKRARKKRLAVQGEVQKTESVQNDEVQNKGFWQKVKRFFHRLKDGMLAVFKMKHKWLFFLLTLLLWGSFWVTSMFIILAFPQASALNWSDALFLMIVGSLGWAMPVQGGIGSFHFIVSLALIQVYGMSQSESLAFATISHSSQSVVMIILGIISVIGYSIQKRKILKR